MVCFHIRWRRWPTNARSFMWKHRIYQRLLLPINLRTRLQRKLPRFFPPMEHKQLRQDQNAKIRMQPKIRQTEMIVYPFLKLKKRTLRILSQTYYKYPQIRYTKWASTAILFSVAANTTNSPRLSKQKCTYAWHSCWSSLHCLLE